MERMTMKKGADIDHQHIYLEEGFPSCPDP
jgi:hypothetical protein